MKSANTFFAINACLARTLFWSFSKGESRFTHPHMSFIYLIFFLAGRPFNWNALLVDVVCLHFVPSFDILVFVKSLLTFNFVKYIGIRTKCTKQSLIIIFSPCSSIYSILRTITNYEKYVFVFIWFSEWRLIMKVFFLPRLVILADSISRQ